MWKAWKRFRRRRLISRPFPDEWFDILRANVAHYRILNQPQRSTLRDDMRVFIAEKWWEGCGGLQITDEHKVTVAAHVCLMLLGGEKHDYFSRVQSVLVYPSSFRKPASEGDEPPERVGRAGTSVRRGPVILAWDSVVEEARNCSHGGSVVIHEFAHQLDDLDGIANGTPPLENDQARDTWHSVMTAEYTRLQSDLRSGLPTVLDEYAATDETEFFAVASERFFTRPSQLKHFHPPLYQLLSNYYRINPLEWFMRSEPERSRHGSPPWPH